MWFFSFLSLVVYCILNDSSFGILQNLIVILKGDIRNTFFAAGLWFFSCLFVVKIFFYFIRKLLKKRSLILLVCFALFVIAEKVLDPRPAVNPHWIYNMDSALYYIILYAAGYCSFQWIQNLFQNHKRNNLICAILWLVTFVYSGFLFFEKDLLHIICINQAFILLHSIIRPLILIFFVILSAHFMGEATLLSELGRNTLYLCGSEYLIKTLVAICAQMLGLNLTFPNPVASFLYIFFLLYVCNKVFVPIEKRILKTR